MSAAENLKDVETHFEFGENWSEFSEILNDERIAEALKSLTKIFGEGGLKGKTFCDIGSGSGLFSLAALKLGAKSVLAVDIDPNSVATTKRTLERFSPNKSYDCRQVSIFDLTSEEFGTFDVVYSWGVLHHTGSMYEAITRASKMMSSKGLFMLALYRKTRFCEFWKKEKKFYTNAPEYVQKFLQCIYVCLVCLARLVTLRNPFSYMKNYASSRGMSYMHDVHDWLGGYPYESISVKEMEEFASSLNLGVKNKWVQPGKGLGLLGSGCDEYLLESKK